MQSFDEDKEEKQKGEGTAAMVKLCVTLNGCSCNLFCKQQNQTAKRMKKNCCTATILSTFLEMFHSYRIVVLYYKFSIIYVT